MFTNLNPKCPKAALCISIAYWLLPLAELPSELPHRISINLTSSPSHIPNFLLHSSFLLIPHPTSFTSPCHRWLPQPWLSYMTSCSNFSILLHVCCHIPGAHTHHQDPEAAQASWPPFLKDFVPLALKHGDKTLIFEIMSSPCFKFFNHIYLPTVLNVLAPTHFPILSYSSFPLYSPLVLSTS